jgi:hypothetical protein
MLTQHGALIKTIDGTYYSARFQNDVLWRIDPDTASETMVGEFDLEIVAGLAYAPVMDEIYTLARETDQDAPPLRLYKVNRETAELVPVSPHVPELDGLKGTTSLTFDWVHREVVLYDNFTDRLYAYDLDGRVRPLSSVAPEPFYNLAFDGHRFLTVFNENGTRSLREVDLSTGRLTPLIDLKQRVNVNAGDILAANHPNEVIIADSQWVITGIDFLSGQMRLDEAVLAVTPNAIRLTSDHLDVEQPLDARDMVATDLLVDAERLEISVSQTTVSNFSIRFGEGDQRAAVTQFPPPRLDLGWGSDTLQLDAPGLWETGDGMGSVRGVDEIDLRGSAATELWVNEQAVQQMSDHRFWRIHAGEEDQVRLVGPQWQAGTPLVMESERVHRLSTDQAIVYLTNGLGWQNPLQPYDVNRSDDVTTLDALHVINLLGRVDDTKLGTKNLQVRHAEYVDVTGDNWITPLDALHVLNHLARIGR